uniref:Uncharacterized protein n=1 Tax=Oryza sativa subsp. japonica TaxID=39947 RepID=Q2QR11_ORYSJ|nr:hypothetical protein LOC_Os12g29180 [Oryza sativa Japonica Group]
MATKIVDMEPWENQKPKELLSYIMRHKSMQISLMLVRVVLNERYHNEEKCHKSNTN